MPLHNAKKQKKDEVQRVNIDFSDKKCQEPSVVASKFGICDDQNGKVAYTDLYNNEKWIATVENLDTIPITFTAIDNCIAIFRPNGDTEKRCDCMMTYTNNIVFVELKEVKGAWIPQAIEQLETTIKVFGEYNDWGKYRHKRAFACNKKHPRFQVIDIETKRRFFDAYRVRLNIEATIKI